jgi:AraC-like DNA-binding protein
MSLKDLTGIAHFSPFYFRRIFNAMADETLNSFAKR